jgi:hypothetical protein
LGRLQRIEKEYELSDIERREGSGSPKTEAPRERKVVAIKNRKDSQRPSYGPQKRTELDPDPISEYLKTENR